MRAGLILAGLAAFLVLLASFVIPDYAFPPVKTEASGYDPIGMIQFDDTEEPRGPSIHDAPPPPYDLDPATADSGPRSGEFYENVQVLNDISTERFNRLMLAITEWVVPEDYRNSEEGGGGCNYCHNPANLASDEVYTKIVARRMIQMTQDINRNWTQHVNGVGVTCHTCHRGKGVPDNVLYDDLGPDSMAMIGFRNGQNIAGEQVGYTSMPSNAVSEYLSSSGANVRVQGMEPLPQDEIGSGESLQRTEWVYAMMMHISESLGVNCTYCHNSRAWGDWSQSMPARVTAWHGIEMAQNLNEEYFIPLGPVYPDYRLGEHGDAPKGNCATCHYGKNKPLNGALMVKDWPSLAGPEQLNYEPPTEAAQAEVPAEPKG